MSIKVLFGAYGFGSRSAEEDQGYLDILTEHGVQDIDTAHLYVGSERHLFGAGRAKVN